MLPVHLQPESHVPLYVQLRDQLRALVHAGDLRPGDRIPASRELATMLGVHRTTVANAYAELESEGLIQGHVGRGTFIRGNGNGLKITPPAPPVLNGSNGIRWELLFADERGGEVLSRLTASASEDALSFVMARPAQEFFPIEELLTCVTAVLKREAHDVLNLGPSDGYAPLKEALIDLLRREGLAVKDENLLVTDGCQQSLDLISKAFVRPGDSVILENPTYPGAVAIFTGARARCLGVPVQTHAEPGSTLGIDVEALEATLAANRVKLIVLTPDFQNPTGTSMPLASRRKVLELAARYQVPIVEDHIYARLHARDERVPSLKQLDRSNLVIHIDSFAKVAFPGLRVGWIVAPAAAIERLRIVKQNTDLHTDQLAQAVLAEFLRRGLFTKHVAKMRKIYASRLVALDEALRKHMPEDARWTRPEGGMCLWLELPPGFDASELLIHVKERGVLFAPGRYFYVQGTAAEHVAAGFRQPGRETNRTRRRHTGGSAEGGDAQAAARSAASRAQPRGLGLREPDAGGQAARPTFERDEQRHIRLEPNPGNICFGCGGANDFGMKLAFEQDNARRKIVGRFVLGPRYQGGAGMAHGGIIAVAAGRSHGQGLQVQRGQGRDRGDDHGISEACERGERNHRRSLRGAASKEGKKPVSRG